MINESKQLNKNLRDEAVYFIAIILLSLVTILSTIEFAYCQDESKSPSIPDLYNLQTFKQPTNTISLDRPIDPLTYVLGPGDRLTIFIWGNIQAQYELTITPEGKILIPTIGPVDVSGMALSLAKTYISDKIMERFTNVKVTTDLTGLRTFRVSIGGAVNLPGIYSANAVTRVSEIVNLAGGFFGEDQVKPPDDEESRKADEFPAGIASHRNIIVTHIDGTSDTADVLLFEKAGDLKYNYKLTDGDEIFVPLRDSQINLYGIFGGVRNPGYFEYSRRDSLMTLLGLGHGLTLDADSSVAELVRFEDDGKSTRRSLIELRAILVGASTDLPLYPDDRIYIKTKKDYNEKDQILILGEVKFPGFYPIVPESTYLSQIILEAGGFTSMASLVEAEMTRFADKKVADREFERLKQMNIADMTDLEYEYFKVKSREKPGRVAVDFQNLFNNGGESDIKLRNGDIIRIPKISEVVTVSGEVANPGLLAYNPEYDYADYIKLAGGFSFRANKGQVRIIKAVTGEWQKAKHKTVIKPGDTILIPEKKKINYWGTIKDIMTFTANFATVYIVVREATR